MRVLRNGLEPATRHELGLGLVPLLAMAAATASLLDLAAGYFTVTLTLYAVQAGLVVGSMPEGLPGTGLGPANRVTLLRSTLIVPLVAIVGWPEALDDAACWWIIATSAAAMVLDGVDGWLARRTGSGTPFGARFDMELDAFFLLGLSALVWLDGTVGAWVLLIGGLRYLFVGAGWIWPVLRAELPARGRRKAACVVQGIALLVCLGPIVPGDAARVVAAAALAVLAYSFAVDVVWLVRRPSPG